MYYLLENHLYGLDFIRVIGLIVSIVLLLFTLENESAELCNMHQFKSNSRGLDIYITNFSGIWVYPFKYLKRAVHINVSASIDRSKALHANSRIRLPVLYQIYLE